MNEKELTEAGKIMFEEVEGWNKPEFGNVISSLIPSDKEGFDCQIKIIFYPVSWRGHKDGEKIAIHSLYQLEGDWDTATRSTFREGIQKSLDAITKQWRLDMMLRIQEIL